MNSLAGQGKLLTWLSPAFPVGAFSYSAGLETGISGGAVHDQPTVRDWIGGSLRHGGLHTDALFVSAAHAAAGDPAALSVLADLLLALTTSPERQGELLTTGDAFVRALSAWPTPRLDYLPPQCPYPMAVGTAAAAHGIDVEATLLAFLTAGVSAQVSVAVRLVPLGQTAGLAIVAALEPEIEQLARRIRDTGLARLGAIGYAADIAQMRHETLPTRIFRS